MGIKTKLLLIVCLLTCGTATSGDERSLRDVYNLAKKSVVLLVTFDDYGNAQSLGSGVILEPKGEIITNLHVVRHAKTIAAKLWNGSFLPIDEIVGTADESDLVILKANAQDLPSAQIAAPNSVAIGDSVIAIGNPLGLESALSTGVVSGFRDMPKIGHAIQTTAPISQGSSGGGLFDRQGRLIGITSSTLAEGQNLNFAIPTDAINRIKRFPAQKLESALTQPASLFTEKGSSLEAGDRVTKAKGFLGLEMYEDAEKELKEALIENKFNPEAHFYMGLLFGHRKNYEKAREEYKIASHLDPESVTPLALLAETDMSLLEQTKDNEFRGEAIRYLRQTREMKTTVKDRYSDEAMLGNLTANIDTKIAHLLWLSGEWQTAEGNGVWKFAESDGPPGKVVRPGSKIPLGNIGIVQAYGPSPTTIGFMWRNSELDLEGWYGKALPGFKCNSNSWLYLHESEDGMSLTGTAQIVAPDKPPKGCTYPDTRFPINLRRK
jgi:tetratricopeptide (TPR) repeat protein